MKYEFLQPKFNEGVLAKSLQGRSNEEFYHYGYKSSKNMIPVLSGPVLKRPGTNYIGDAKHSTAVFIPFFKDKDNTYIIELGVATSTISCTTANDDATVTIGATSTLRAGDSVSGDGIPDDTTISSITDSTHFELSALATASATVTLTFLIRTGGYLRVWSQNQLLTDNTAVSSPPTYEADFSVTAFPWTAAELNGLKSTQSGDIIFVCSPTKPPQKIFRTLSNATTSAVADDTSVWAIEEFVTTDGPYTEINIYDESVATKRYTLKLSTEPTATKRIGAVEFNTIKNELVLANHGLQVGQKIKLHGSLGGSKGWGNIRQNISGLTAADGSKQTMMSGTKSISSGLGDGTGVGTLFFDLDVYVISTTSTSFQFSDTDGGPLREFELVLLSPETIIANAQVYVEKYVYSPSATPISLTLYNNGDTGSAGSNLTNTYFHGTNDIGRLIRINPLLKGGNNIGGIKWAWGIIKTVSSSVITVEFKSEMANTRGTGTPGASNIVGTSEFRLGAFSLGQGYPHVAQIYQQRMVLAATAVQPSTIWLSETANFYSFSPTVIAEQGSPDSVTEGVSTEIIVDSNALTFTLDSDTLDEIKWLGESKKLAMGTSAGIYMLYGAETDLTVTPFRFTINRETSFSATDTAPVIISNALLYTQIGGKDVQALELEGGTVSQWVSSKISLKGYDVIKNSEIQKMVWQERPFAIIWFMMANGKLLTLSYDRSLEFKAWSEHVIAGKIYRKVTATIQATADRIFTASTDSGLLLTDTVGTHGLLNGQIIQVTTTGTLPTGLSLSTNYYVVNKTANTFKLETSVSAGAIAFTDVGGGTHSWHKPTIYTVAGDQTSMFVADKYVTVSNYEDSNWNVSQEIINVLSTGGNTEITTRLDSSSFAGTTSTNPIIESDGSSHAQVTDIDMIPTASHDQIWFKVKRTINGVDVYHVETLSRFPTEGALDRNEYVFSDSAVTGTVSATKIVSGLKHLKNEEVQIYYEGMQHANLTVTNTGGSDETVTLSHTQGNEHVTGLAYDAEIETLEPSAPENQFSYTKRLIKAAVLVEESLGIQLEYNDLSEELLFRTTEDAMGRQIPLFSGLRKLSLSGIGWDTHNIKIVSNGPFPMQLNAIIIEAETGGS